MSYKLETNALHAGHDIKNTSGTRAVPIYQTSSYVFNDSDHDGDDEESSGHNEEE